MLLHRSKFQVASKSVKGFPRCGGRNLPLLWPFAYTSRWHSGDMIIDNITYIGFWSVETVAVMYKCSIFYIFVENILTVGLWRSSSCDSEQLWKVGNRLLAQNDFKRNNLICFSRWQLTRIMNEEVSIRVTFRFFCFLVFIFVFTLSLLSLFHLFHPFWVSLTRLLLFRWRQLSSLTGKTLDLSAVVDESIKPHFCRLYVR